MENNTNPLYLYLDLTFSTVYKLFFLDKKMANNGATSFIADAKCRVAVGTYNTFCFNIHDFGDVELQVSGCLVLCYSGLASNEGIKASA